MNPLRKVNLRQATKTFARFVQKGLAGSLLLCVVGAFAYSQRTLPETIVEVTSEEVEPAPATTFDEIFGSVAQAAVDASLNAPAPTVQTATIKLNALSFSESEGGIHLLSYGPATEPVAKRAPPRAAPKPEPKKPTAVAQVPAVPRVKMSSDNWPLMTPYQKWKFITGYVKAQNWDCDSEGLTPQQQIQQLADHPDATWNMVYNFGLSKCRAKG